MRETKVHSMIEGACEAFWRYVQTEELLHNPWAMIFWRGMLLSYANVAPERRKNRTNDLWEIC